MGECLEKLPHSCGTKTGLQVFGREDGTVDGFCFSCDKVVRHPYGEEKQLSDMPKPNIKTQEQIDEEIKEIQNLPVVDLVRRKLRSKYLDKFGIKVSLSEVDGKTPTTVHYPYYKEGVLSGYKNKTIQNKRIWSIGDLKATELFGWQQALKSSSKKLIITEGEEDAVAVTAILDLNTPEAYKKYTPAVVSLARGSSSVSKDLDKYKKEITNKFKEVIFCFDADKSGEEAVNKGMMILPEAKSVTLPAKDANQCLVDGLGEVVYTLLTFNASKPKNTRLVFGRDIHEAAREQARPGELTWPWEHINDTTRGIRYGETIYIGAGVKMGKSEILNSLAAHFITEHNVMVFAAKPEESNKKSYKLIAGKIVSSVFHDPKIEMDYEAYDKAGKVLADKLLMVDLYQHMGWNSLRDDIVSAAQLGARVIFIDPITNLTNGMSASDANTKLQDIAQDLAAMALDLNVVIFIFCHLKANDGTVSKEKRAAYYREGTYIGLGNCPHEGGGDISSAQFAGSRAMMRSCNMMVGIEGNKDSELETNIRNIRNLRLLEDREFGETGIFPIFWNPHTQQYQEI